LFDLEMGDFVWLHFFLTAKTILRNPAMVDPLTFAFNRWTCSFSPFIGQVA